MKRGHPLGCARGPLPDREPAEGGTRTRGSVTAPRLRPRGVLTVAPGRGFVWVVTGRPGPSARSPGGPQTVSDHGARPFPVLQARGPWSPGEAAVVDPGHEPQGGRKQTGVAPWEMSGRSSHRFTNVGWAGVLGARSAARWLCWARAAGSSPHGPRTNGGTRLDTLLPRGLGSQLLAPQESGQCSRNPHPAALESGLIFPDEDATALLATTRGALHGHADRPLKRL